MALLLSQFRLINYPLVSTSSIRMIITHIAHLQQQRHNSKCVIFQERILKVFKCYNFLWMQRRHNCSPAASFANCVMTLYLLKVHLQTFLSIPVTQKCQILSCDTLVAKERYVFYMRFERSVLQFRYTHTHRQTHTRARVCPSSNIFVCVCVYIYIYDV